ADLAGSLDPPASGQAPRVRIRTQYSQEPVWPDFAVALPELSNTMQRSLQRLQSSQDYRVLTSLAWLQPLERQTTSSAMRIHGREALAIDSTATTPTGVFADPAIEPPAALPSIRYRLDGSLRLRQRQFRHVDLNLVWSERATEPERMREGGHDVLVHRLKLSRPIQLNRLEYFDSPWLGVLVHVEPWERPAAAASLPALQSPSEQP
ncbi:MAG: peptidoglycan binding protein CsiV, partial [Xanthomonadaceae bacterium]|nr:peptidoglycan binding protein CsiV [Xanthomonadaceae bacterium]